ncbi:hypothetical protein [Finegoldia magna]|uniref:hypothetical protein n=1 Tax=Finegoldia magna TaxID=1260 RepID=UPI003AF402F8
MKYRVRKDKRSDSFNKKRQITKDYYDTSELVGKTLLALVNLPARKMMGVKSQGMLLSAIH